MYQYAKYWSEFGILVHECGEIWHRNLAYWYIRNLAYWYMNAGKYGTEFTVYQCAKFPTEHGKFGEIYQIHSVPACQISRFRR